MDDVARRLTIFTYFRIKEVQEEKNVINEKLEILQKVKYFTQ